LVRSFPLAVRPRFFNRGSASGPSSHRSRNRARFRGRRYRTSRAPWAPLQSVTAAASRLDQRSLDRGLAGVGRAGASPGVQPPSATSARAIVAQRFTWPLPSALGVSHALSGLIPPGPCGLVSCRSRPWGSGLQRFLHPTSRNASRRPLPPCRWSPRLTAASSTSRLCSGRAFVHFASSGPDAKADALLTFILPEAIQLARWAEALPSCACSVRQSQP